MLINVKMPTIVGILERKVTVKSGRGGRPLAAPWSSP